MNYERKVDSMDSLAGTESFYEADDNRRKRMLTIAAVALIAVILLGVWYAFAHSKGADTAASGAGGAGAQNVPNVTVVIPGRVSVQAAIAANGTIAARREMPVGIAGEGGQVLDA